MTDRETADSLGISPHTLRNWEKRNEDAASAAARLTSRANKRNSRQRIFPRELLALKDNAAPLEALVRELAELKLSLAGRMLLFALDFLEFKGLFIPGPGAALEELCRRGDAPPVMKEELLHRLERLPPEDRRFLPAPRRRPPWPRSLHKEADLPGMIYQSLRREGSRSREGAWFTPLSRVRGMIRRNSRGCAGLFDPCCGSGLFLCAFAALKRDPLALGGMDIDPQAVFISRLNLFVRFPDIPTLSHIREGDSLKTSWDLPPDYLVATNPPWGAHFGAQEKRKLARLFPEISSGESSSYFLCKTIAELPPGGRGTFLLPPSLFYVRAHEDIRRMLLEQAPPRRLEEEGRLFRRVYTEALSCDFVKGGTQRKCRTSRGRQRLSRYRRNPDGVINYKCSPEDQRIIDKIEGGAVRKLSPGCRWLLGVVTGDNRRYTGAAPRDGGQPLLTGRDLLPFRPRPPRLYLYAPLESLQQSRRREDYRQEKLVYRFIGRTPVFALDKQGLVPLNSANCLIPPEDEDPAELLIWYNSALFRFLWRSRYASVKMLRHHLEELPLPLWTDREKETLAALAKTGEKRQDMPPRGEELLAAHFGLTPEESRRIQHAD